MDIDEKVRKLQNAQALILEVESAAHKENHPHLEQNLYSIRMQVKAAQEHIKSTANHPLKPHILIKFDEHTWIANAYEDIRLLYTIATADTEQECRDKVAKWCKKMGRDYPIMERPSSTSAEKDTSNSADEVARTAKS